MDSCSGTVIARALEFLGVILGFMHAYFNGIELVNMSCFEKGDLCHLRYDLTDKAGVLENKVLGMFHGLDD